MLPAKRETGVLTPWSEPIGVLENRFQQLFRHLWENGGTPEALGTYPVDITEDEESILVEAEMPGFAKDEIDVSLDSGMLSIAAERKSETREGTRHLNERRLTRVQRTFSLPGNVDESQVDARLEDGVLKIKLQKSEADKRRKISVN